MRLKDDVFVGLDGDASVGMTIFSPRCGMRVLNGASRAI